MHSGLRNVVLAQLSLVAAATLAAFLWRGQWGALSALGGGAIVLLNSLLLAWRVRRAGELEGNSVVLAMYMGAAQRFLIAAVGFALGIGALGLDPLPMIAAFAIAQFGYAVAAKRQVP